MEDFFVSVSLHFAVPRPSHQRPNLSWFKKPLLKSVHRRLNARFIEKKCKNVLVLKDTFYFSGPNGECRCVCAFTVSFVYGCPPSLSIWRVVMSHQGELMWIINIQSRCSPWINWSWRRRRRRVHEAKHEGEKEMAQIPLEINM